MLKTSARWADIEMQTRDTRRYHKKILDEMRVYHSAYTTCADIMRKFIERPTLVSVWAISCPGLLKSKTNELALQEPGTPMYLTTLAEKMRIDMLYDAVAHLKNIENERPVRPADIELKLGEVDKLAQAEARRIVAQEAVEADELREIGDGSESVEAWAATIKRAQASKTLVLRGQGLTAVPPELFALVRDMEIVDLGDNKLRQIPNEIETLTVLKKLYLDTNELQTLPASIARMHEHLTLLALADNPLQEELFRAYLGGLPGLFAFLKSRRKRAFTTRLG
ncbi:hypothetical protein KFE25_000667 [Diacronema lutheri]|uniref:Leucine-rich repeat domain-containing protein n=1 Tax=Diacronema lutheri TaxID=2081491 RepID=A0A8J5XEL5_DIALT|nr:hypothetical protein KFE25_000667 [Diacronema lutheri]